MAAAIVDVAAVFVFVVAAVTFVVVASWPTDPEDRLADQAKPLAHGRGHRK